MSDTSYHPKQRMGDALRSAGLSSSRNRVRFGDHPMRSYLDSYVGPSGASSREYLMRKRTHRRGRTSRR